MTHAGSIGLFFSLLAIPVSASSRGCADPGQPSISTQAAAERYIRSSEEAWAKSVATSDASVVKRILADDFVWVLDGRVLDKATAVAAAAQGPAPFLSNTPDYVHVRFFGGTAVAQGSETWTKTGGRRGRFVWTDTWVDRDGCWQIVNAQDTVVPLPSAAAVPARSAPRWATLPEVPPLPPAEQDGFVDSAGARIHYAVFHRGGGSPVVLLHGGFASAASWGFEVPRLMARHEVIVIDSRGHGRSSRPSTPLSYEQMASDTIAVMDALHAARASIVGSSDGGIVGLILAIRQPGRIDRLFVWGAAFNTHAYDDTAPPDPAMKSMGARFMARMEAQYRALSPTPDGFPALRAALGQLYEREPNLTSAELGRIQAPTVVADGEHEQFIARGHTETLARLIPGARLVILPNVSHGGPQQDPAAFHRAVAELLDHG